MVAGTLLSCLAETRIRRAQLAYSYGVLSMWLGYSVLGSSWEAANSLITCPMTFGS